MNSKTWNYLFGLCSLLGLVATIVMYHYTLYPLAGLKDAEKAYEKLLQGYWIIAVSVLVLILVILAQAIRHERETKELIKNLGSLPEENNALVESINRQLLIVRKMTYNMHDISHYCRYITLILRDANIQLRQDKATLQEKDCIKIANDFEKFVGKVLISVTAVMNIVTKDTCASTIKLTKDDKVKTFFRDPLSYRARSSFDIKKDNKRHIYHVSENTAFECISSPNNSDTFFACDNLSSLHRYENVNQYWQALYNATIAVPIQADLSGKEPRGTKIYILGFLCCDNQRGGFESVEVKDYLAAIGDMLYNVFMSYDRFTQLALQKGYKDEKLRSYGDWDNG